MTVPWEVNGQQDMARVAAENAGLRGQLAEMSAQLAELRLTNSQLAGWRADGEMPQALMDRVAAETAREMIHRHARDLASRRMAELDWQPPASTDLAADLAIPRQNYAHRIPGLAGWNHNLLVQGPRKIGKSQLMANLSASLSRSGTWQDPQTGGWQWTAGKFLGWSDCYMGGNVAYLNAEMDADDWRDVFRALPPGSYDPARIHPLHVRGQPFPVITSPAAREWFTGWLAERHTEVLIIDTWGAFCGKNGVRNLNDDGEARKITDGLDEIKQAAGVATLAVLIHMPHQVPGMRHLERFKGAGAVGDWADVLWNYVADEDGTRYLSALGRARIDTPEQALWYDQATGALSWGMTGSRAQTAAGKQRQAMLGALQTAGSAGLLTGVLMEAAGGHTDTARKAARTMERNGELATETRGKAVRWWLASNKPESIQGS